MDFSKIESDVLYQFESSLLALAGQSTEIIAVAKSYYDHSKPVFAGIVTGGIKGLSTDPVIKAQGITLAEGLIYLKREKDVCIMAFTSIEQLVASYLQYDIETLAAKIISMFTDIVTQAFSSVKTA